MREPARLDDLMFSYLAGDVSGQDLEELTETLRQDKRARRRLAELAGQDLAVRHVLQMEAATGKTAEDERSDAPAIATVPKSHRRWLVSLASAAALVLCFCGVNAWQVEKAVVARVVEARGEVRWLMVNGEWLMKEKNSTINHQPSTISPGKGVQTGPDGYLKLAYADGSVVEVQKDTRMTLDAGKTGTFLGLLKRPGRKLIRIETGALDAQVAKQSAGREMRFRGHFGEVTVAGTRLKLMESSDKTRVLVTEGRVRMEGLSCAGSVEVARGQFVEAGAEGLSKAKPATELEWEDGLIVFQDDFEKGAGKWSLVMITSDAHQREVAKVITDDRIRMVEVQPKPRDPGTNKVVVFSTYVDTKMYGLRPVIRFPSSSYAVDYDMCVEDGQWVNFFAIDGRSFYSNELLLTGEPPLYNKGGWGRWYHVRVEVIPFSDKADPRSRFLVTTRVGGRLYEQKTIFCQESDGGCWPLGQTSRIMMDDVTVRSLEPKR